MKPELLKILQHTLGLDQYGQGRQYRNHFVAGEDDAVKCRELVSLGCMAERAGNALSGGSPVFHVTPQGIAEVAVHSEKPPKRTHSQRRYSAYLAVADCYESFGHYLKYQSQKNRQERGLA